MLKVAKSVGHSRRDEFAEKIRGEKCTVGPF